MLRKDIDNKSFLNVRLHIWIYLVLVIIVIATYWPVRNYDFIAFDDNVYVTDNRIVKSGFSREGFIWAFMLKEERFQSYWQPLTWLSHMLDVQVYGLNSGNHHLTNLIFHILNTLLLFKIFYRMTDKLWPSVLIALLFATHPLNVESVAWVAARKNVLSTFFWFMTILLYIGYVRKPNVLRYLFTFLIFVLGLMAKPMLVTLPFVLLLLDYWPLGRLRIGRLDCSDYIVSATPAVSRFSGLPLIRLLLEKVPFFVLSAVSIYLSSSLVQTYQTIVSTDLVPLNLRLANGLVSYIKYILKMMWPQGLAVLYPFPQNVPKWQVSGSLIFLTVVSISVIFMIRKKPYLFFGWLWYLGTLLPVMGLIQAGVWPEMADRWAYIPLVGIFVMVVWGVSDMLQGWKYRKALLTTILIFLITPLVILTQLQLRYWQDSVSLFEHTLETAAENAVIHNNLGIALHQRGRTTDAIKQFFNALQIDPGYADAHLNLGNAFLSTGKGDDAIKHYKASLKINPNSAKAHYNLGVVLTKRGELYESTHHYLEAIKIDSNYAEAHNNLGVVFLMQGRTDSAIAHFQEALRINPDYSIPRRILKKVNQSGTRK